MDEWSGVARERSVERPSELGGSEFACGEVDQVQEKTFLFV